MLSVLLAANPFFFYLGVIVHSAPSPVFQITTLATVDRHFFVDSVGRLIAWSKQTLLFSSQKGEKKTPTAQDHQSA